MKSGSACAVWIAILSVGLSLSYASIANAEIEMNPFRTWDIDGQKIKGRFVKKIDDKFSIELDNGKQVEYLVQKASAIDQIYISKKSDKPKQATPIPKDLPAAVKSLVVVSWTLCDKPRGLLPGIVIRTEGETSYIAVPHFEIFIPGKKVEECSQTFAIRTIANPHDATGEIPARLAFQAPINDAAYTVRGSWNVLAVAANKVPSSIGYAETLEDYNQVLVQVWSLDIGKVSEQRRAKWNFTTGKLIARNPVPEGSNEFYEDTLIDLDQPFSGWWPLVLDQEGRPLGYAAIDKSQTRQYATFQSFDHRAIAQPMLTSGIYKKDGSLGENQVLVKLSLHDPLGDVESANLLFGKNFPKLRKGNKFTWKVPKQLLVSSGTYQVSLTQRESYELASKNWKPALTQPMLRFEAVVQLTPEEWQNRDPAFVQLYYKTKSGKQQYTPISILQFSDRP